MQIFRKIPFFRLHNDTQTTVKRLKTRKNDMRGKVIYLFVVLSFSACRKNQLRLLPCCAVLCMLVRRRHGC